MTLQPWVGLELFKLQTQFLEFEHTLISYFLCLKERMCTEVVSRKTRQRKRFQCHSGRINNFN